MPQNGMPGDALARRHRRCASILADLLLFVAEEETTLTRADAIREMDRLVQGVLDEVRAAEQTVLDALAGTERRRPAARLLSGRLDRLQRAGIHVGAAVRAGNVPLLRRTMTRFDALARAACAVQLDVYGSAITADRRARRADNLRGSAASALRQAGPAAPY